ncbi:MAG: flagellar motor switch protein FliG, partial [Gammaproteobacteria bacterium]
MADDSGNDLSGVERAAAFLLMLGEREASDVLRYLEANQIDSVAGAMSKLPDLTPSQVRNTVLDFCKHAGESSMVGGVEDSGRHVRKVLTMALGSEKANDVVSRVGIKDDPTSGVESLARRDPEEVATLLANEHPQVIATLMAYQDTEVASAIVAHWPAELQRDVILRMATLENVSVSAMEELNELVLENWSQDDIGSTPSFTGGPKVAAGLLNKLAGDSQTDILSSIRDDDSLLAERIEDCMFTFEDLLSFDDRSIQTLLGEVSKTALATALKGADKATQNKFYSNMSKRAAELLADDIEVSGPVKIADVESSQRELVDVAKRLLETEQIVVKGFGKGDDFVF